MITRIAQTLSQATDRLQTIETSAAEARLEAEVLLCHALGLDRAALYVRLQDPLAEEDQAAYNVLLARRLAGEPVAYILGQREFYGLSFLVDRRVLIPRPETELLVDRALAIGASLRLAPTIADVGCGSGCVAVTLAVHLPTARLYVTDISAGALQVTRLNALRHGVADRVIPRQGDLLMPLPEAVDLLVANLPYINQADYVALPPGIAAYEPRLALDGGVDGLDLIRRLLAQAAGEGIRESSKWAILLEIGSDQGPAVVALAQEQFPTATVTLHRDLAGRDRVVEIVGHCDAVTR